MSTRMNRLICCLAASFALIPAISSAQTIIIERPIPLPPPPDRPLPPPDRPAPPRPPQRGIKMEVRALGIETNITDGAAVTKVDQTFHNPHDFAVEGTYIFPLDDDVAVSRFTMDVNGQEIEGKLLDVKEARQTYEQIVRGMKDPALLEYVGTKMFKASIFPINPHSDVRVRLSYTQMLETQDGLVRYRYPMNTEKYLPSPIQRLSVLVRVESKTPIKSVFSPSHEVAVSRLSENKATASMEVSNQFPDRDFELFYMLSEKEFGLTVMTYREPGEDGYFVARISPNATTRPEDVMPKNVAFVLDTSGSMSDEGKIGQARSALKFCLDHLNERDAFTIITFSHEPRRFSETLVPVSTESREKAAMFIDGIEAVGGTNIHDALLSALKDAPQADPTRPFYIVFLTDGQPTVGVVSEPEILKNVREANTQRTRLFVFGVGHDVNTRLLDLLAEQNRGTREYVEPGENLELALSSFYRKISDPVLSDLALAFGGLEVHDVYPPRLGDLFGGMELVVVGRYNGSGHRAVELEGTRRGAQEKHIYETKFPDDDRTHEFLPRLWATRKVGYLLDEIRLHGENAELKSSVVMLAKKYGIITPYTSYLVTEPGRVAMREGRGGGAFDFGQPRPRAGLDSERVKALRAMGYIDDEGDGEVGPGGGGGDADAAEGVFLVEAEKSAGEDDLAARGLSGGAPAASEPALPKPAGGDSASGKPAHAKPAKPAAKAPPKSDAAPKVAGRAAVGQSKDAKQLQEQDAAKSRETGAGGKKGAAADLMRIVGTRTFYKSKDSWVDSAYDKKDETKKIELFSDEYFELLGKHKDLAKCFALGDRVIVMVERVAYETVPPSEKSGESPKEKGEGKDAGQS
ncbi:MAG: VWA domain-containing protein [Phycisphaerales bacterium]|nr:VWA domain-containing protein [Phycisphaerales bacterium]